MPPSVTGFGSCTPQDFFVAQRILTSAAHLVDKSSALCIACMLRASSATSSANSDDSCYDGLLFISPDVRFHEYVKEDWAGWIPLAHARNRLCAAVAELIFCAEDHWREQGANHDAKVGWEAFLKHVLENCSGDPVVGLLQV